jgi:hypothetical protein
VHFLNIPSTSHIGLAKYRSRRKGGSKEQSRHQTETLRPRLAAIKPPLVPATITARNRKKTGLT